MKLAQREYSRSIGVNLGSQVPKANRQIWRGLAGFGAGLGAGALATFAIGAGVAAAAPIALIALTGGIAAQIIFNSAVLQDEAERLADQHLPR